MTNWKRIRSAAEWGFFYGIISWLLATGVTNTFTAATVWAVILSRTLMGVVIGMVRWNLSWWIRGLVLGFAVNLPLSIIGWLAFGWIQWILPLVVSGMVFGLLIELAIRPKASEE